MLKSPIAPLLLASMLAFSAQAQAPRSPNPEPSEAPVRVVTAARGLERPLAVAFLRDGRALVTEKAGRLRIVGRDGAVSLPLGGVPAVASSGQGGLLDVVLDPRFMENRLIYLSYSEPGDGGAGTAVARARLGEFELSDVQVIYRQRPKVRGGSHFGSRLAFAPDGTLFVTQGDRYADEEQAQDPASLLGKIVRINRDGSIPRDNPFASGEAGRPEVWSTGHRNVQAAAIEPGTGRLWTVEHGARRGDELNHPEAGRDYGGARSGEGTARPRLGQPAYSWDPALAPSSMAFLTSDAYPGWRGSAFVGSLDLELLVRLVIQDGKVVREERLLDDLGERVRAVQQGPDKLLYLLTDNGRLLRLEPAGSR